MKSSLTRSIIAALAGLAIAASASAITVLDLTSDRYIGSIVDGIPPNEANETTWVNSLAAKLSAGSYVLGSETLTRSGNRLGAVPSPSSYFDKDDVAPVLPVIVDGFDFVLGKYGAGQAAGQISYVWYVGGLTGEVSIPSAALSHVTRFGAGARVSDGGSTVALLGLGLALLGIARRKLA